MKVPDAGEGSTSLSVLIIVICQHRYPQKTDGSTVLSKLNPVYPNGPLAR